MGFNVRFQKSRLGTHIVIKEEQQGRSRDSDCSVPCVRGAEPGILQPHDREHALPPADQVDRAEISAIGRDQHLEAVEVEGLIAQSGQTCGKFLNTVTGWDDHRDKG